MLVIIKTATVPVVSFVMNAEEPALPKTVWLDPRQLGNVISQLAGVVRQTILVDLVQRHLDGIGTACAFIAPTGGQSCSPCIWFE